MISNGLKKVIVRNQTQCPLLTETEENPMYFRWGGAGLSALISRATDPFLEGDEKSISFRMFWRIF